MSNLKRNPKLLVVIGVALVMALILLSKSITPISSFLSRFRRLRYSEMSFAVTRCDMSRKLLKLYYEQTQAETPKNAEDFVNFIMNLDDWQELRREPPPEGYKGFKVGFFFLLPEKLESDMPAFIAYTTPVTDKSGKVYRLTLLLRGSKIEILPFDKQTAGCVEWIFGSEQFKKEHADLWAWRKKAE